MSSRLLGIAVSGLFVVHHNDTVLWTVETVLIIRKSVRYFCDDVILSKRAHEQADHEDGEWKLSSEQCFIHDVVASLPVK